MKGNGTQKNFAMIVTTNLFFMYRVSANGGAIPIAGTRCHYGGIPVRAGFPLVLSTSLSHQTPQLVQRNLITTISSGLDCSGRLK